MSDIYKKLKTRALTQGLRLAASLPMEGHKGVNLELVCAEGAPQTFVELLHLKSNLYRIFI